MKKLFGFLLFWSVVVAFYYSPSPVPSIDNGQNTGYQHTTLPDQASYLDENAVVHVP